jgi:6-phosphogluconolactonase (cycloisomerase 2 family)
LVALGRVIFDSGDTFLAKGADGAAGQRGSAGTRGSVPPNVTVIHDPHITNYGGGPGGGGSGGNGAAGSQGAPGAGGAGGTIKIVGSVVQFTNTPAVDVSGGHGGPVSVSFAGQLNGLQSYTESDLTVSSSTTLAGGAGYVTAGNFGDTLTLQRADGKAFNLVSADLNYASTSASVSVTFTGTKSGGSTVSQTFTVANTGFATFTFPASFTGLTSVRWSPAYQVQMTYVVASLPGSPLDSPSGTATVHFTGQAVAAPSYAEGGLTFSSSLYPQFGAGLNVSGGSLSANTSVFVPFDRITMLRTDGKRFDLSSIALSTTASSGQSVTFTGTKADGTTVTQTFTVPGGGAFSTFTFPSSFTGLKSVSWVSFAGLHATNVAVNFGSYPLTSDGQGGRFLYASNSSVSGAPTATGGTTTSITSTSVGNNPYYFGSNPTTPDLPDLAGGAETFGLVPGGSDAFANSDLVKSAITNAKKNDVVAVVREHLPQMTNSATSPFADYAGYDAVLFINLTGLTLSSPTLGLKDTQFSLNPPPGPTNTNSQKPLQIGGLASNTLFGGTGNYTTITGLAPHAVWVTLVPINRSSVPTNGILPDYLDASIGGSTFTMLTNAQLGDSSSNDIVYLSSVEAAQSVGAAIPGLQNLAVSPDGNTLYGVNTTQNLLVVANAADLTERQTFQNGIATVTGLGGASAVVAANNAAATAVHVYVAGATSKQVAFFATDSNGNLVFKNAMSSPNGNFFQALALAPDGSMLFAAGPNGVAAFNRDTSTGLLTQVAWSKPTDVTSFQGFTALSISRDGKLLYAVSRQSNALVVYRASDLTELQHFQSSVVSNGLVGARAVTDSPDHQYVYVAAEDGGTVAIYLCDTSSSTPLTRLDVFLSTEQRSRGLADVDGIAVDANYLYVTSNSGNSLAIYNRLSGGGLRFAQLLRGSIGLDQPTALALDGTGTVYVSSQVGFGLQTGGLARFVPNPTTNTGPASLTITYSSMATLNLTTGASADIISMPVPATVATLNIDAGDGDNIINVLDFAGNTSVTAGSGNDYVTLRSAGSKPGGASLTVNTNGGNDFVRINSASAHDNINVNVGTENDVVQVEGQALDPLATVFADGGPQIDTLLFDAGTLLITPPNPDPTHGTVKVSGSAYGSITYINFEGFPGFQGATANAGGPYIIDQGTDLHLAGTATPATNSTIGSVVWDINADGDYSDATGLSPTITWAQLESLGVLHPGTYTIGMRVISDTNTVDAYATLIVRYVAPTITLTAAPTWPVGVPYTLGVSARINGADPITGWKIQWGDGTTSLLPSDATSAKHTYLSVQTFAIDATVYDTYTNPTPGTQSATPPPHIGLAPTREVMVAVGDVQTVNAGGPYTIHAGDNNLVLTATTYGAPTAFAWDVNGDGNFTDATGSTPAAVGGITTSQASLNWLQLQNLLTSNGVIQDGPQTLANVRVRVTFADGATVTAATSLTILDTPPTATIKETDTTVGGSSTVSLINPIEPSAAVTAAGFTYSYDFNNDGTFETTGTANSASVPGDLLAHAGTRVVHARISDSFSGATDYTTTIHIADVAPQVQVGPDQTVPAGTPVSLGNVTFSYPGYSTPGQPETFTASIDWGDSTSSVGQVTVTSPSGVATTGTVAARHLFQPGQTYTVTVTVFDRLGKSGSASFHVTVGTGAITVSTLPDQHLNEGGTLNLDGLTFTDSSAPGRHTVTVNWGDGTPTQTLPASAVGEPALPGDHGTLTASHPYGQAGQFPVTVSITAANGAIGGTSFSAIVNNVAPTVDAGPDQHGGKGVPIHLGATFSDPSFPVNGVSETFTATIDWGDNTSDIGTVTVIPGSPGTPTTGTVIGDHVYNGDGPYTVTVTVQDNKGGKNSGTLTVFNSPPTVVPGPNPTGNEGSTVTATATFSDPAYNYGSPKTYTASINWGDGSTTSGTVVVTPGSAGVPTTGTVTGSHVYIDARTYPVTITVADEAGTTGQAALQAVIANLPPTLDSFGPDWYLTGKPYTLTDTFNDPGKGDTHFVTIDWGDGITSRIDRTASYQAANNTLVPFVVEPTATSNGHFTIGHVYNDALHHLVVVTVTDDDGTSATRQLMLQENAPPVANAGGPYVVNEGGSVTLNGTGTDPDGDTLSYAWDFNGNGIFGEASTPFGDERGANAVFQATTLDGPSDVTVRLRVTDDAGLSDVATAQIHVNNVAPANLSLSTSPTAINENGTTTLSGTFTDPGILDTHVVVVTWGDGQSDTLNLAAHALGFNKTHQYLDNRPGNAPYSIGVKVTDKDGASTTGTVNEVVNNVPPTLQALTGPASIIPGQPGTYADTFTDPGTLDTHTAVFDWGDGPTGTPDTAAGTVTETGGSGSVSGSHTYAAPGTYTVKLTVTDKDQGSASVTYTVTVGVGATILDPSASGALTLTGNGALTLSGVVYVDSSSSTALRATGNAGVTASQIKVVGGVSTTGNAALHPNPITGAPVQPDPLASLVAPTVTGTVGSVNLSGQSSLTIGPGLYSSIKVSGQASLTLLPGVYVLVGGGFTVSGTGSVTGHGVCLYNAGSNYPGAGGSFGSIALSGNGTFSLTPPDSAHPYTGILIFQARDNTKTLSLTGNAATGSQGTIYAKVAQVSLTGNGTLHTSVVADTMTLTGNGGSFQLANGASSAYAGSTAHWITNGVLSVAVQDDTGAGLDPAELARLNDAVTYLNAALGSFGVDLSWAATPADADVHVHLAAATPQGGAAEGVLGFTTAGNDVFIVATGWNFYTGADAGRVGAGQFDFLTLAVHELAHTVGLGESSDPNSVMYEYLAPGMARRTFTDANLAAINSTDDRYMKVAGAGAAAPQAALALPTAPLLDAASTAGVPWSSLAAFGNSRQLQASGGSPVLIGGAGEDAALGGQGRDLLIGGMAEGTNAGGGNQDLPPVGSADAGLDAAAAERVFAGWGAGDDSLTLDHGFGGDNAL